MLKDYILPDILQYIFNKYISHRLNELEIMEFIANFKFNVKKYVTVRKYYNGDQAGIKDIIVDDEIHFRETTYYGGCKFGNDVRYDITFFEKSIRNGTSKGWYDTGVLAYIINYKDDKIDGEYINYYKNGNIKIKTSYKKDLIDGIFVSYYENGNIETEISYDIRPYRSSYESHKLKEILYNYNNQIESEKIYGDKGWLELEKKYYNGKIKLSYYYSEGKTLSTRFYDSDEKLESVNYYDGNGITRKEIKVNKFKYIILENFFDRNGKLDFIYYYENKIIKRELMFDTVGNKILETIFDDNGIIMSIKKY
jgi:antitoxin component YwqK of YwqJK toxin-antitoxin module